MATKTRRPKPKAKLRGGTNDPPETIIPLEELLEQEAAADAEASGEPIPIAGAVDQVLDESAKAPEPVNRLDPAKAYDSPERLSEWDRQTVRKVNASAKEVADLRADHDAKAEVAKDAKKALDLAIADHFKLIADRREGRGKPQQGELFDPERNGHPAAQADLRTPGEVPPVDDDTWKAVPLAELVEKDGLPAKVAQLLGDAGIHTMGELAAYTEPKASGWTDKLTDLKGVGPAKVEAIDAATTKFWTRWKPHAPRPEDGGRGGEPGPGDGDGQPGGDRPAGGDGAAPAGSEPADGEAGYQTEGVKRIGRRKRGKQAK